MDIEIGQNPDADAALLLVTLAEQKASMHIVHNVEDQHIASCIKRAVAEIDGPGGDLRRSVLPRGYTLYAPAFKSSFDLPYPPLQAVTAVKYKDELGVEVTVPNTNYIIRKTPGDSPLGRIDFLDAFEVPAVLNHPRAVSIEFTAGYQNLSQHDSRLEQIRTLIIMLAGHFYSNPEATIMESKTTNVNRKVSFGYDWIADRLRIPHDY